MSSSGTTFASVFYGALCGSWSLLRAAVASKMIKQQLLAMDLLILRKANCTLESSSNSTGLLSCPLEVLYLIKDQMYAVGVEEVTASWKEDFLHAIRLGRAQSSSPEPVLPSSYGSLSMTSRAWEQWGLTNSGQDFYSTWSCESNAINAKNMLDNKTRTEVDEFLSSVGLGRLGPEVGSMDQETQSWVAFSKLEAIYTPVFARIAHTQNRGVEFEVNEGGSPVNGVSALLQEAFNRPLPSLKPFFFLWDKYQVEFIESQKRERLIDEDTSDGGVTSVVETRSEKGKEAEEEECEKSQALTRRPNPQWMLWANGYW